MAEHRLCKAGVRGSIPLVSTDTCSPCAKGWRRVPAASSRAVTRLVPPASASAATRRRVVSRRGVCVVALSACRRAWERPPRESLREPAKEHVEMEHGMVLDSLHCL